MISPNTPEHAIRVWIEAGKIHLHMPSTKGGLLSHRLTLENNPAGWARLQFLVANRSERSLIGTKGDLTQHQLDRLPKATLDGKPVKAAKVKDTFAPAMRSAARDVMRRLGL